MGQFLQSRAVYLRDTRTNKDPFLLVGPMQFENKACISMTNGSHSASTFW